MSLAQPLSPRLARLRERLAGHHPVTDPGDDGLRWAAVAVVLAPDPEALLFIRRSDRDGDPWSGHMALPGGRQEEGDRDLVATAIREAGEEVGLELTRGQLAGTLDDVVPRTPRLPPIAVRPYVFVLPSRPPLTPNPEVAAARWVALDHLLHPDTYHEARLEVGGEPRDFPAYRLDDAIVWGLTERVVSGLLRLLRG
jgi:8-oxo-dGTP pyrophosphatase MutT (NUDIX family)